VTDGGTVQPDEATAFETRLDAALEPPSADLVAAYFNTAGPFAAETFDVLGVNDPMQITTDDLLAVTLLNVVVPPFAVRALLGKEAPTVTELLVAVPVGVPLWEATTEHLDAATGVWTLLRGYPGVDWVTAGKLLARKRPMLIPVFDSVIQEALQPPPDRFWATLRAALGNEQRRATVEAMRPPGLTPRVSTLRLLDVAIWMRYSDGGSARREQARLGLPVTPRAGQ